MMISFWWFVPDQCIYSLLLITCKNTTWHEQSNVRNLFLFFVLSYYDLHFSNHISIELTVVSSIDFFMLNKICHLNYKKMQLGQDFYSRFFFFIKLQNETYRGMKKRERERETVQTKAVFQFFLWQFA